MESRFWPGDSPLREVTQVQGGAAGESIAQKGRAGGRAAVLWPWYAAEFLGSYASTLLLSGVYDWARADPIDAGPAARLWLSAIWGFAYIFISLLAGKSSEKFGPRKSAVGALTLSVLTASLGLSAVTFPRYWMLILVMLPFNLTGSLIWPAIESGVTRTRAKMGLSPRIMLYNLSWSGAGFFAFFTHGVLESWSWYTIFAAPAVSVGLAAAILGIFGARAKDISADFVPAAQGDHELEKPEVRARAQTFWRMALIGNGLAYLAVYVLFPVTTQLAKMAGVNDLSAQGYIGSIWFMVRVFAFGALFLWTGWHYRFRWQLGPMLCMAASLCGMLIWHQLAVFIILQMVFGISIAVLYSGSLYYAMHVSAGHGGHAAFHEAVIGMGTMVGPTIGALVATGDFGESAMKQIAIGATAMLILGTLAMGWMAMRGGKKAVA